MCETVGSVLKYFAKDTRKANPDAVSAKTMMRLAGLEGQGPDDLFILRLWSEIAGPDGIDSLRFHCSERFKKQRLKRWPLGKGSKTLHNFALAVRKKRPLNFRAKHTRRALALPTGDRFSVSVWRRGAPQGVRSSAIAASLSGLSKLGLAHPAHLFCPKPWPLILALMQSNAGLERGKKDGFRYR